MNAILIICSLFRIQIPEAAPNISQIKKTSFASLHFPGPQERCLKRGFVVISPYWIC